MWDLGKLVTLLGGSASPPGRPLWTVLSQNIDAEHITCHQQLMHIRLFVDAHQDQGRIEGNGAKGVGSHPVLGTAMMGGHYRHTARKAAKHLPKKHRIKWHDSLLAIAAYYLPRTAYRCCVRLVAPLVWRG